ncbi:putative sterigmatocystin biosynthesis P450 monooxygenase STCB [Colletotrichum spaethianum]|uniref:Sterigmatocystin biosynthesis P450 monooxygenase STCB n=1 Tax=Colletotrichum spaethianum TaxID=700344 RepID=A0AA37LGH2_9PEZI|nr:putative sterigmatocystin biosynthesis P450 monooxygenase STCB [Colletotrichum spaethianum]GKT43692.1 putative sterigmatocystin biosynthesis P450 monooxygenase STCB [Colletotrichum spaethianum]
MLLLSPLFLGAASAVLVAVYLVRCVSSPLWKVPGPRISAFTSLVLKWHELRANRTRYVHGLHQKYGPVVRVAPNEACFTSYEAVKEIYCSGGSGYDKTEFYDLFRVYGRRCVMGIVFDEGGIRLHFQDHVHNAEQGRCTPPRGVMIMIRLEKQKEISLPCRQHAKRKRIIADRYANSNVLRPAPLSGIQERSQRFINRCEASVGKSHDIFMSLHSYACDCVTHHLFHPYGSNCLENEADEEMMHQVAADDSLQNRLVQHYSPTLHKLLSRILYLFAKPRETPLADTFVIESSKKLDPASFTLLSRLHEKSSGGQQGLDQLDMAGECLDHMAAGIDTTGDGLCFLMWELSQPRSLRFQEALRRELRENAGAAGAAAFDRLPFLDAVVQEGLRCFPAIPMSLPRYVPRGGRTIDGYSIPEGTVVSCQAYSVHRINEEVFPEPDVFDPNRWMEATGDAERKRLMFAFANGGRGCVGKHLALAEMKTLLADIYSRYTTLPERSMTAESMAMSDQLISSRPLGQRCLLQFVPVGEKQE